MENYKKAQQLNISKLKTLDEKGELSERDILYRAKIQTQYDILEPLLKS